jgi:transcriptional regulator with XRE-family HTH domain
LRDAGEKAGLSQHQLARLIGVAGGERVSRWELAVSEPWPDIPVRVAKAVDLPAVELHAPVDGGPDLRALRFAAGLFAEDAAARSIYLEGHLLGAVRQSAGNGDPTSRTSPPSPSR